MIPSYDVRPGSANQQWSWWPQHALAQTGGQYWREVTPVNLSDGAATAICPWPPLDAPWGRELKTAGWGSDRGNTGESLYSQPFEGLLNPFSTNDFTGSVRVSQNYYKKNHSLLLIYVDWVEFSFKKPFSSLTGFEPVTPWALGWALYLFRHPAVLVIVILVFFLSGYN